MSVYKKLQQARIDLQSKELKKSGKNSYAGYDYFELGDFLPSVQEIFQEVGLCGAVNFEQVTASLKIHDIDNPDDVVTFSTPTAEAALKGCTPVQNLGAMITYIRRYLWVTAMEIVEHDAEDVKTGKTKQTITPTSGAWEALDDETRTWMLDEAMSVAAMLAKNDIDGAANHIDRLNLDADYKVAFWTRLDSKQRSALKKYWSNKKHEQLNEIARKNNA